MTLSLAEHMALLHDIRNSLTYWYPKVKDLVPTPKTTWIELTDPFVVMKNAIHLADILDSKAKEVGGYPVFLRTDVFSGKHYWRRTCFVTRKEDFPSHIVELIDTSLALDLPVRALVLREFLELDTRFRAFTGDMPVATEVRVLIRNHKIERWFFYWPEEAIKFPKDPCWREKLQEMRETAKAEQDKFLSLAKRIAQAFEGYWSADFARLKNGEWVLIDMALGEVSWKPEVNS